MQSALLRFYTEECSVTCCTGTVCSVTCCTGTVCSALCCAALQVEGAGTVQPQPGAGQDCTSVQDKAGGVVEEVEGVLASEGKLYRREGRLFLHSPAGQLREELGRQQEQLEDRLQGLKVTSRE